MDRKEVLLKAAYEFLKKVRECEWEGALGETVFYDEAECDGFCLMNDIAYEMDYPEVN